MALSNNPTRTRTIEANWLREINRRWAAFRKSTTERLRAMNAGELVTNDALFALDPGQQRIYMQFLLNEIERLLMGTAEPPNWQAVYQTQAYQRGIESTRASLISQGASIVPTEIERQAALGLEAFTATPSIGTTGAAPIHRDALEFLHTRSFTSLKGWTDAMARETRQILFDGVEQGKGIDQVVREMVDRQGVSRSRARVIARTETIQAFQRSSTNEAQRASEELDEEVLLRWLTVRDDRVRHLHATWHGTLSTPKDNRARINVSPWNCRCGTAPVIAEANTEKKRAKFKKEREQLLTLERR